MAMNRWHIRKDASFGEYSWFLFRDNPDDLDQNSDLACIEGGSWATWEETLRALEHALHLDVHIITEEEPVWL